jgi:uncharacterized membrane protein YdjX (TVP38/TMEM64 family)
MSTQKKNLAHQIIGQLLSAFFGFFLASFVVSFVMNGVGAFVLAIIGGIVNSFFLRLIRIRLKPFLIGLTIGYFLCLVMLVWFGEYQHLSINLWVSSAFVLSLGLTQVFLSDDLLTKWLDARFPTNASKNSFKNLQ